MGEGVVAGFLFTKTSRADRRIASLIVLAGLLTSMGTMGTAYAIAAVSKSARRHVRCTRPTG